MNLLQCLPPISSAITPDHRLVISPPAHNSTAGSRRASPPYLIACSATKNGTTKSPDDYHATLKALNSKGRFPRKSFGQHYMLNSEINEQLSGAADVGEGDVVLEIGPGTGSLTNVLINAGAFVVAVEKDSHMAALVSERFAETDQLKVLNEDFLKCHISSFMQSVLESMKSVDKKSRFAKCLASIGVAVEIQGGHPIGLRIATIPIREASYSPLESHLNLEVQDVVANIPFNISTDVVKQLLPMGDIFSEVVLLLQEETALRLVESSLRTSEYRPINIFVNFYSDAEFNFKVPRANFFPQPNVDAAVVTFKLKRAEDYPSVSSTKSFFSMVNSAFNGKRKMLRKSLQHIASSSQIENALENLGLQPTSRPGELTLDDFVKLHNVIMKRPQQ